MAGVIQSPHKLPWARIPLGNDKFSLPVNDAIGKAPSGTMKGKSFWIGSYDQCLDITAEKNGAEMFRGQYCRGFVPVVCYYNTTNILHSLNRGNDEYCDIYAIFYKANTQTTRVILISQIHFIV